jgi:hypothetical protein
MARDRALPFSDHIKRTNEAKQPWIATILCLALWAPCACLLISSSSVIISVVTVGASTLSMLSYLVPVALYILAPRLDLQVEGRSAWSLRKFSRPVAVVGALFCLCVIIVQCLPSKRPVTVNNVSWSPVVIVGTLLISIITWKTYGNKHYSGPIRALTKWETGMELDLDSTLHPSTQRGRTDATTSLKLAVTPCYPETVPTVHVASAETVETNLSMGEWTSASFTTTEGGTESISDTSMPARRAAAGATATMGRVDEDDECQHQHHADGAEVLNPNDIDLEKGDYEDEGYYHTDKGGSGQSRHDEEKRL